MYRMLSATKQTAFLYQYGNIMHGHWENTQDADVQLEQILAQAPVSYTHLTLPTKVNV